MVGHGWKEVRKKASARLMNTANVERPHLSMNTKKVSISIHCVFFVVKS